jgi:hypothetical protein
MNRPFAVYPASQPVLDASTVKARGADLKVLPCGTAIADVSMVHPLSTHLLHRAASTAGAAASHRDQQKRTTYAWLEPNGCEFVPVSAESSERLSPLAMKLLHTLGDEAAGPEGGSWSSFVEGAPQELSVGLVEGNHFLYRASVGMLARSSGARFYPSLARPTDDRCAEYCAC